VREETRMRIDRTLIARTFLFRIPEMVRTSYTGCPRRNVRDFGRVFLMLKYTDITRNTYVQS